MAFLHTAEFLLVSTVVLIINLPCTSGWSRRMTFPMLLLQCHHHRCVVSMSYPLCNCCGNRSVAAQTEVRPFAKFLHIFCLKLRGRLRITLTPVKSIASWIICYSILLLSRQYLQCFGELDLNKQSQKRTGSFKANVCPSVWNICC